MNVALDSQCVSYLVEAIMRVKEPTDALADEKKAVFRCFLYGPQPLYVPRTADGECRAIRQAFSRNEHEQILDVLLVQLDPPAPTEPLKREFLRLHPKENDCQILAEAEASEIDILLTFDTTFVRRLASHTRRTKLCRPSDLWSRLAIPRGTAPHVVPYPGGNVAGRERAPNSLSNQAWWRWG